MEFHCVAYVWTGTFQSVPTRMVPATGFEPVRCYSLEPESSASANSATRAKPDKMYVGRSETETPRHLMALLRHCFRQEQVKTNFRPARGGGCANLQKRMGNKAIRCR